MKIKGDYLLDTIGGEKMAVPITVNDGGLAGLIRLNEVGAFLWEKLQGGTTEADLVKSSDIGIRCERRESDSRCEEVSGKTSHKGIVGGVENGNEKLPVCRCCFYITDAVSISGEAVQKL